MPKKKSKFYEYSSGPVEGEQTKYRVYEAKQCKSKNMFETRRCQGVKDHSGPHWCYTEVGWLEQWKDDKDIENEWDWAASTTPPNHKFYIHPKLKIKEHYHSFDKYEVIGKEPGEPLPPKIKKELEKYEKHIKEQNRKKKK